MSANTPSQPALETFSFAAALPRQQRVLHSRQLMLILSYLIEDRAASVPGTTLVAAFQRQAFVRPQLARYESLTSTLAQTYILGLPDAILPDLPGTTVIPLEPAWPLVHEWVVIATGPACCVGLFATDSEASQPARRSQHFDAYWSIDTDVIDTAYAAFVAALGLLYTPIQRDTRAVMHTTRQIQQDMRARLQSMNRGK